MIENQVVVRSRPLLQDETSEYTRIYVEHGEWWLDYLRATDEKIVTAGVLLELLSDRLTPRNEQSRILDIGAGEGSPTLMFLDRLNEKGHLEIDFIEPSPRLRTALKGNLDVREFRGVSYSIVPKIFQGFECGDRYDVIFGINSLCGFIGWDLYHLKRMLHMLKPNGICLIVLQSRKGDYKRIQEYVNRGRYLNPMLDAENLEEMLLAASISHRSRSFKACLLLDVSWDGGGNYDGIISLLLRQDFALMANPEKARALDRIHTYMGSERASLEIQNKVFMVARGLTCGYS
jgi:SAM-dependent methyltransferase